MVRRRRTSAGRGPAKTRRLEVGGVHLGAPAVGAVGPEAEHAALGVVEQHSVAGAREQPGHREVGRVGPRMKAPGRHEGRDQAALVLLEGTLGHVVLDLAAALVDRVRPLAEAEVALAARGAQEHAHPRHVRLGPAHDPHPKRDHAGRGRRVAAPAAGARQDRWWRAARSALAAIALDRPGGAKPARGGTKAERAGAAPEHDPPAPVDERQTPGLATRSREQVAARGRGCGRRRGDQRRRRPPAPAIEPSARGPA